MRRQLLTIRPTRRLRGMTLLELVTSLLITSILLVGMTSAVVIASKALPDSSDPVLATAKGSQAIDLIAAEIESALYVSQLSATSIAFTVADRNGDGIPERISYSWSGRAGDPLLRQYNGGAAVPFVPRVDSFNLTPNVKYVAEQFPGAAVEDGTPTLLQDFTATSGLGGQNFGSNNSLNFGQYFSPTLASDVVGWRPTSVTFKAQLNRVPGSLRVQMRPATVATFLPTSTVLDEQLFDSSNLTASMLPYSFDFPTLPRLSPGDAICLTVMWDSGAGPAKLQSNNLQPGMLKTAAGGIWSYVNNNCLSAQLYGVLMRSGPTQSVNTQYLLSLGLALRAGSSSSPMVQTSVLALNHPEILGGLLELKFDRDPTTVDANGDGVTDWTLGSGTFNSSALSGGVWTSSSDTLTSGSATEFNVATVVDLRMQSTVTGATATATVNTARLGSQYAGLRAGLALQSDGTQTLTISQATSSTSWAPLISYSSLPAQPTDVHLVVDPVGLGVAVTVNGIAKGCLPITRISSAGAPALASISASGGAVKFSYVRVRILKAAP